MSQLSPNFTLEEFIFSQTAVRKGIDNGPSPEIIARLVTVAHQMELVRAVCGNRPIRISSGYRSPALNDAIGGSDNSAHTKGWAVDFTVAGQSPYDTCKLIEASGLKYDQVINEAGKWTHISFDPRMRRQELTAHFSNGKATYTKGL